MKPQPGAEALFQFTNTRDLNESCVTDLNTLKFVLFGGGAKIKCLPQKKLKSIKKTTKFPIKKYTNCHDNKCAYDHTNQVKKLMKIFT